VSSTPENSFRASVHRYLCSSVYQEKMCNPYRGGTPDDWYSGPVADLWIEYKFLSKIPVRVDVELLKGKEPMLSHLQADWLRERLKEGRNVRVVVGCPEGGVIFADLEWEQAWAPAAFRKRILSRQDIAAFINKFTTGASHELPATVHNRTRRHGDLPNRLDERPAGVPRKTSRKWTKNT
jgi:hypothetical protein